ncbi:hypothetical protein [Arthrobacter sp. NPDC092385]|uniref:hypothetical protein n=1 Tax=Arthrobacter sp. NPDC092385 TaxID=3363943 RepID=UPI0038074091
MQNEDTLTAMEFAGLSAYETWMHYCNMGGSTDYFEFDAYLHGLYAFDSEDADLVSQAVNELIDDVCPVEEAGLCRAPYSWTVASSPGFVDAMDEEDDVDGFYDAPVRVPVDDLVAPHSVETFGSRFLAGLDLGTLTGRPGIPLPPGATVELLGEVLDSGVIGRIVSGERK